MPFLDLQPESFKLSPELSEDIHKLVQLLGDVLKSQDDEGLFQLAQKLVAHSGDRITAENFPELEDPVVFRQISRAFTVLFQLINLAEQKEIVRVNRARFPRRESIDDAVKQLKDAGVEANEVQSLLPELERFYRSPSPAGIEILSRWLRDCGAPAKRCAAEGALARIHTPQAILALSPAPDCPQSAGK